MSDLPLCLVDVFAEEKYAGNQLAVIGKDGALSSKEMQKIANEMHFSETTFILSDKKRNAGYDVRIFTPVREMPFAGHPTLGTAYVIRHTVIRRTARIVKLNLKVGQVPVTFERGGTNQEVLWMTLMAPTFGRIFDATKVSQMLNIDVNEIENDYPIQEVSTSVPFIIVPLKTLDAVRRVRINKDRLVEFTIDTQAGVLVFCQETYDRKNDLNVRVFADLFGIPEDPATGSGNSCLAGYLSRQ